MKISVIVPIFNVDKYLNRCIDSIIQQTYKNIEIILVDDGSTDKSGKIADEYKKLDARTKVIHQKNIGLPGARNSGLKIASGEYVSFIDSDDKIDSTMMEEFVKTIVENYYPDIVTSDIYQYSQDNKKFSRVKNNSYIYNKLIHKKQIIDNYLKPLFGSDARNSPSVCNKLYKYKFLKEKNITFDETLPRAEDFWFNILAFQKAETLYSIDKAYYHYYVIQNSTIRKYRKNDFEYFLKTRKKLWNIKNKLDFIIDVKKFNKSFFYNIHGYIFLIIENEKFNTSFKKVKNIFNNKEFQSIIENVEIDKIHIKIIKYLLIKKCYNLVYFIYYLWHLKIKMMKK